MIAPEQLIVRALSMRRGPSGDVPGIVLGTPAGRVWIPASRAHELADLLVDLAETLEENAAHAAENERNAA